MPKTLLIFFFLFLSLGAKMTSAPQSQEELLQEVDQEKDLTPEQTYNDPRGTVQYDKDTISDFPIDKETIRDFQKDERFNYKEAVPEDTWWTRFKQKINDIYSAFIKWLTGGSEATGVWRVVVELLPYLLLAGFLAFIVWIFMKIDSGTLLLEKIKVPETTLSDDEELIQRKDLEQLIDQALSSGNYRLAVRFYYLLVLQKMSGKNLIEWQVQKTNHEYIFEIEKPALRSQFIKITDIYDYIWYGNFEVNETAFAKAEKAFKNIYNQL